MGKYNFFILFNKWTNMKMKKKISILPLLGFFIAMCGLILSFCWDSIFHFVLKEEFRLTPTSKLFVLWRDLPIAIELAVYFFNWTNPEEILDNGFKPKLVEIGPYIFKERFEKVNVTWNKNGTITYLNRRYWYFDPEKSVSSLDCNITTLNPIPLAAAYMSRYDSYFFQWAISGSIRFFRQKHWITKTVGEFLFTGYPDPIMTLASIMPFLKKSHISEKFSWFDNRNGSSEFEGTWNMETGEEDRSKIGIIRSWNYRNRTDSYRADCGIIKGSDGVLFHSGQKRHTQIEMFSSDCCKTFKLQYLEDVEVDGIRGYRFVGTKMLMDNGDLDPNNWCNCNGECLPHGTLNISSCYSGAPGFASAPHFLYADPYYLQHVEGLQPNESNHRSYIILEPETGIPLEAAITSQLNLLLQPYENIALYNNVPRIVFPMLWIKKSVLLPPEYSKYLKFLLAISEKGVYLSMGIFFLGTIIIIIFYGNCYNINSKKKVKQGKQSYPVLQVIQSANNTGRLEELILLAEKD